MFLSPGKQSVLFNASAYQESESTRLNLCFCPDADFQAEVARLDEQIVEQLRPRLAELSLDLTVNWRRSPLKQYTGGTMCARTKVNISGKMPLRRWDLARKWCPYQRIGRP